MVHTYTPTYYRSLQDSISSICNTILPFSFKKRRLPAILAAEQQLSKQQSDNLKWQQDSFHQILKLMGLCKEGIIAETEVSAFRTHLLENLMASPIDYEPSIILKDKLIFLQELLYAKCISEEEYHASKRPLLQRLAIQGAEIEAKDVIVGGAQKEASNDEWSVIDLKDEKRCERLTSRNNQKVESPIKQRKVVASAFDFVSPNKNVKFKDDTSGIGCKNIRPAEQRVSNFNIPRNELAISSENPFWNGHLDEKESETKYILMVESSPARSGGNKGKKKPFSVLFQREPKEVYGGDGSGNGSVLEGKDKVNSKKKSWGFDGFRKWKKNDSKDETAPLSVSEKSDGVSYTEQLVANPIGEGPDTKKMKRKLHPNGAPTNFFIDKVLEENVKKELTRIQEELRANNPNVHLSDDQIETISTRLPVDNEDLTKFFPKTWCDKYGDVVLDVVRKEFKDHVGDVRNPHIAAANSRECNSKRWMTFDDDENSHPNLFAPQASFASSKNTRASLNRSSVDKGFKYNPFFDM
ncbi:uncharacterized protein [Primulina huaijiensis]|uniref:uncharacterized protein n=1 Tax=Primulina huaijiensis TaxID=1492673 RepID=UPI003CC6F80C